MDHDIYKDIPNTLITPLGIIGEGGSAYIIEAVVNYDYKEFKREQRLVFKHCMGYLTKSACDLFIDEAKVLNNLRINLIDKGICNNFPIYYGYYMGCLFGGIEILKDIINNVPQIICHINKNSKLYEIPDILFYYANYPEMGIELYNELIKRYSVDCLLAIRDKLKVPNFNVIANIFRLTEESYDSNEIYNFLAEELQVDCSPNIVMSKINGFDLSSNTNFLLTDGLIFEMIYTNACLIKFNGEIFRDINLGNIIIELYPYPRIYKINSTYYMFTDGYRLVIIDAQITAKAKNTRDLLGSTPARIPSNKFFIITQISSVPTVDKVMLHLMPKLFQSYIVTEKYVKEIMAAYPDIKIWSYL